ncbi:hypothetical protein [Salinirussus salinus]|jgi:hypothetical protein|nr:hypothetical protein [Salinirussus salinus]
MTAPRRERLVDDHEQAVTAHNSSPDRTVFVEQGNKDGWIATDLTVSLDP